MALLKQLEGTLQVDAIDCNEQAVELSLENARRLEMSENYSCQQMDVEELAKVLGAVPAELQAGGGEALRHADLCSIPSPGSLDCIVSNPPYIPTQDMKGLQPEVASFMLRKGQM